MVELTQVAGRTVVTRCRANSPLRLLTPRDDQPAARVTVASYGGGLVRGDLIDLRIKAGEGTKSLLSTQASTKVFRSAGRECQQRLSVSLGPGSLVASLPDPVVCFARSQFSQSQRFDLAADATLVMLDWFTSGRAARGERWAMDRFFSCTEIAVENRSVFRERLELASADGDIGSMMRMGRFDCFATLVMVGPQIREQAAEIVMRIQREPIIPADRLLYGASSLPDVTVLRVAGRNVETVGGWIRRTLAFLGEALGIDPWSRKW